MSRNLCCLQSNVLSQSLCWFNKKSSVSFEYNTPFLVRIWKHSLPFSLNDLLLTVRFLCYHNARWNRGVCRPKGVLYIRRESILVTKSVALNIRLLGSYFLAQTHQMALLEALFQISCSQKAFSVLIHTSCSDGPATACTVDLCLQSYLSANPLSMLMRFFFCSLRPPMKTNIKFGVCDIPPTTDCNYGVRASRQHIHTQYPSAVSLENWNNCSRLAPAAKEMK